MKKLDIIIEDLKKIKEIRKGFFDEFIEKEFMNQHKLIFFHTSHVKGRWMYYCTHCNNFHVVDSNWKDGSRHKCMNCRKVLEVQRYKKIEMEKSYIVKFEVNSQDELIVRYFYLMRDIRKNPYGYNTFMDLMEVGRENRKWSIAIKRNTRKNLGGYIYHKFWGENEVWAYDRTRYCDCYPATHLYTRNLGNVLKRTGYEYSGCREAIAKGLDPISYLSMYDKCPNLERLVKSNATAFLKDLKTFGRDYKLAILNRATSKKISKIIKNDLNCAEAEILVNNDMINPDIGLIRMMAYVNFNEGYKKALSKKKTIKYIFERNQTTKKKISYADYKDYVEMVDATGAEQERYPINFWKAHDEANKNFKIIKKKHYEKLIRQRNSSKEIRDLQYENKYLMIRAVEHIGELVEESRKLHNCVRRYAEDVANGNTNIFFIRKIEDKQEPYCTLELKERRVVQCRAVYNTKPNDEVVGFVNDWCEDNGFISCF